MSGIESAEREDYDECQAGVAVVSGEVRQLVSEATGFNREWLAELPRFMIGNIFGIGAERAVHTTQFPRAEG